MEFIEIIIPDKYIRNEWWEHHTPQKHLTHHMHYNSPFETDWDCGNCDGARCEGCHEYYDEECFSAAIPCDKLEEILAKEDVAGYLPEEAIKDLVYDDMKSYVDYDGKRYRIKWPKKKVISE